MKILQQNPEFDRDCLNMAPREPYLKTTQYYSTNKHGTGVRTHHVTIGIGLTDQSAEKELGQLNQFFKKALMSLSTIEEWVKGKRRENICKAEWLLLAKAVDRILLMIFSTSFVVSTSTILMGHAMFRID